MAALDRGRSWPTLICKRPTGNRTCIDIERGELRVDLDIEAASDGFNGVFYYQTVVRGESFDNPETLRRCRESFEIF